MTQDNAPDTPVNPDIADATDGAGADVANQASPLPPTPKIRADGWLPARQRAFLESLAMSGIVTQACEDCAMSPRAAYTLRLRSEGVGFRLGWEAAILIARARLVDTLMERAINGWDEVVTRSRDSEATSISRHRIDNRLAMSLLGRLDRRAEVPVNEGSDAALARIVAQDFEAFLDLVESGASGAAISLFLALRTPCDEQSNPHQNDPIGQCELCGAKHGDEGKADDDDPDNPYADVIAEMGVYCENPGDTDDPGNWRTEFPPPPGFDGEEWGEWNSDWYERTLTFEELDAQIARKDQPGTSDAEQQAFLEAAQKARDAYFGFTPAGT